MAISASTAFEVRPTNGLDTNGAGFSLGGNTFAVTDLASTNGTSANPTVTTASYTWTNNDVGDWLYIASGTSWMPGFYQIASQSGGTSAVLTAPSGVGTAATLSSGSCSIDRSQKDAAWTSGTNLTVDHTTNTKVNPDGYTITKMDVGNVINITTTGTGAAFTTGRYQITVVTTGGSQRWQLDQSPAAIDSVGATWAMGGAAQTIGEIVGGTARKNMVKSNKCFVKAEATITVTAPIALSTTAAVVTNAIMPNRLIGYTTTRTDGGRVTIQATGAVGGANFILNQTTSGWAIQNFILDCNGQTTTGGITVSSLQCNLVNVKIATFTNGAITLSTGSLFMEQCELTGSTTSPSCITVTGAGSLVMHLCTVHDNAPTVVLDIQATTPVTIIKNCLFYGNTSAAGVAFGGGTTGVIVIVGNTFVGTGAANQYAIGFTATTGAFRSVMIQDNVIANYSGTGGIGIQLASSAGFPAFPLWDGNAYYNNTTNRTNADDTTTNLVNRFAPYTNVYDILVTADPFTNSAGGNYTLNNNNPGGAQIRGHGIPGTLPGATGTGYLDMGCWQHADPAAGGGGAKVVGIAGSVVTAA